MQSRRRRQSTLENLERRDLMAVVPTPVIANQRVLANAGTSTVNYSAPTVAIDPTNPNHQVAVFTGIDTSQPAGSQIRPAGRYTNDGGATWSALAIPGNLTDPTTTSSPAPFTRGDSVYAAFDRSNNLYVAVLQHNDASNAGTIVVTRYSFGGAAPNQVSSIQAYQWNQAVTGQERQASVNSFQLAVDDNLANFTDPTTGLPAIDANSGNVYLAMGMNVPPPSPAPGGYSPWVIGIAASANQGLTWGTPANVAGSVTGGNSFASPTRPRMAISQGAANSGVEAGRITVIWDETQAGRTASPDPLDFIQARSMRATGNVVASVGGAVNVASTRVLGSTAATYGRVTTMDPFGVGPGADIASDNSTTGGQLGAAGVNSGRLYVAYTDWDPSNRNNPASNTDIFLATSDDGGISWNATNSKVNDDSSFKDGKTASATAGDVQNGLASQPWGRTQFMPSVAVDRASGALLVSFFDTRDDASNARVANYIATSIDGGSSFAPQTFVNAPYTATDAITGQSVTIGPLPDNQSASSKIEPTFSFGDHQALAVLNGTARFVWSGNRNGGHNGNNNLSIQTSTAAYASGPRVLSLTSGPIQATTVGNATFNNTTTADGRPILDGFTVTFDRPIAAGTFTAGQVVVTYRDVLTSSAGAGTVIPVSTITPVGGAAPANTYLVRLDGPSVTAIYNSAAGGVGTYSVKIGPDITDLAGNKMDQNGNAVKGQAADAFTQPATLANGQFDTRTLPLIVPGPHVVSTGVPGVGATSDNLVTDGKVSKLNVTFDRDINASTFGPDDVLAIVGPAGNVLVPVTFAATGVNANAVIPDNPAKPLTSTISILPNSNSFPIKSMTVSVNINHAQDSDLKIQLKSPQGTIITLADGVGGNGQNFVNTVFDDSSVLNISNGTAPFNGTYAPQNAATPGQGLSAFTAQQLQGNWQLIVTDKNGNLKTGVLNGWSLTANPAATVTQLNNRTFQVGFPEQQLRGTYTITLGSDIRATTGYTGAGAANLGSQLDTNLNAGLDLLFGRNPGGVNALPQTYTNSTISGITDATAGGATTPLVSTVSVPTAATPFIIGDLNLQVNISHPRTADLKIELIGPDGTTVTMVAAGGLSGANLTNTIFDDQAGTLITAGTAPYGGPFRPIQPLSAFNGRRLDGTWRLRVTDTANGSTGSLVSWSLTATSGPSVNYAATGGPVAITAGSVLTPSIAKAVIPVSDAFTIQAITTTLSVTYPNDPDIKGDLLVYPAGVDINNPANVPTYTINLFNQDGNVGPAGTRQNYTNTVFDDTAPTPIQNGGPPFNGRFTPRQALSTLIGQNASSYQYVFQVTNYGSGAGSIDKFSVTMEKSVPTTGLGESVADRAATSFRIFTMDPTLPLSSSEWTPVGPASYASGKLAGRMSAIAVDPADPSGNTVYVGAASGGIWKTSNFLTSDSQGPTYIPLTDFGPTSALRIGNLTTFGVNGDPSKTVVLAGTGEVSTQYGQVIGGLDTSQGVGFLLSKDGGQSWTLLDSANNVDASGKYLPIASRNHDFVGMTINKVLIDPRLSNTGNLIMYAAISDPNGRGKVSPGIWRSLDGGNTWQLKKAGNATDIAFDENSGTVDAQSNPAGNYRTLFVAFGNGAAAAGVYISPNQGDTFNLLSGTVIQQTIRDDITHSPIPVSTFTAPTGQRIIMARPALTGNINNDVQYQGWIYALGADASGRLSGLWLTKDLGQSWTKLRLPSIDNVDKAVPSNTTSSADYDPTANGNYPLGLFNLSLAIDPNNPNITYVGGTKLGGRSTSLVRIDSTLLADAHAFFTANDRTDGGGLQILGVQDGVSIANQFPQGPSPGALGPADTSPYVNLLRDPSSPFLANTTIYVSNARAFSNSGSGATWTPFDSWLAGSEGVHQLVTIKDALTGKVRLIAADDQGIFTGIDNNGTVMTTSGSAKLPAGTRNGNLQTTQFYYGASQPSNIGAQAASALFYGMAQDNGFPTSNADIINKGTAGYGNLQWNGGYIGYGTSVATDQTGSGTVYRYKWGQQINDPPPATWSASDFFKVQPDGGAEVSRTFNLFTGGGAGQWPGLVGSGQPLVGNFTVNPLTKNQILLGSSQGFLFSTENQGSIWNIIANPGDLDGTYVKAPAFGAPDPNGPGVPGALNNYLLAGTQGGRIYVTLTGGGTGGSSNQWFDISQGLVNNDPIMSIITNPTRGSHEAYALSSSRVYRNVDTSRKNGAGTVVGAGWVDITGDLYLQTHTPFGDTNLTETLIKANSLTSIAADWRYVIPDTTPTVGNPNPPTHPLLYVAGNGGVLRTYNGINGAANWAVFPDLSLNAPQEGGGMPSVMVTDLDLALGNINPTNGRPDVSSGPNVLLASTYGRGSFAIKLAPIVFKNTVRLATGSDSGRPTVNALPGGTNSNHPGDLTDLYTNVLTPTFQGLSEQSAFGGKVAITLYDATDPLNPIVIGGYDPASGPFDPNATYFTDTFGNFSVSVNSGVWTKYVSDGTKVIRVQATDQAGTRGNLADFSFTLDTTPPGDPSAPGNPPAPGAPTLDSNSDSGFSNSDNYTNSTKPFMVMTPTEGNITVYLLRASVVNNVVGAYQIVNTIDVAPLLNGASPTPIKIQDPGTLTDGNYVWQVQEIDPAGNLGATSAASAVVTIDTTRPNQPGIPVLNASTDSGTKGDNVTNVTSPLFSISSTEPGTTKVYLKRNGVLVPSGNPSNPNSASGSTNIQDPGPLSDGTYAYSDYQVDLAGNVSVDSPTQSVRILTAAPAPAPSIALFPDDDSGVKGDNATKVRQPRFYGTAPLPPPEGYTIELVTYASAGALESTGTNILPPTALNNTGNYLVQVPNPPAPLADGTYYVATRIRDIAGNYSVSPRIAIAINNAPPSIVPSLRIDPADDTGIKNDNKTTVRKPRLIGNTTPGAIVDILDTTGNVLATTTALTVPDSKGNPAGFFSTQLPFDLNNGTITLRARARDNVGNVNPNVGTLTMTIFSVNGDYDGDGKADLAVFNPPTATWFVKNSGYVPNTPGSPPLQTKQPYGYIGQDVPVPADFDGNGTTDMAVYLAFNSQWSVYRGKGPGGGDLGQYHVTLGTPGKDTPVPADFDGDGKADLAVYRPTTGLWQVLGSSNTVPSITFGTANVDKPVPGNYDNVGRDQFAVFGIYAGIGKWSIRNVSTGATRTVNFGQTGDIPVPGDYDGIGYTEPAVYRPSVGKFFIFNPTNSTTRSVTVGLANDIPVPRDYDGDGKVDPAVYRPSTALWSIAQTSNNQLFTFNYGAARVDMALPGPLSYRVSLVNPTTPVPAAAGAVGFARQVASGQVQTPASVNTGSNGPAVVVGSKSPSFTGGKKAANRVVTVKLNDNTESKAKTHRASGHVKQHPMRHIDNLIAQLGNEGVKPKSKA